MTWQSSDSRRNPISVHDGKAAMRTAFRLSAFLDAFQILGCVCGDGMCRVRPKSPLQGIHVSSAKPLFQRGHTRNLQPRNGRPAASFHTIDCANVHFERAKKGHFQKGEEHARRVAWVWVVSLKWRHILFKRKKEVTVRLKNATRQLIRSFDH